MSDPFHYLLKNLRKTEFFISINFDSTNQFQRRKKMSSRSKKLCNLVSIPSLIALWCSLFEKKVIKMISFFIELVLLILNFPLFSSLRRHFSLRFLFTNYSLTQLFTLTQFSSAQIEIRSSMIEDWRCSIFIIEINWVNHRNISKRYPGWSPNVVQSPNPKPTESKANTVSDSTLSYMSRYVLSIPGLQPQVDSPPHNQPHTGI